MATQSSILAWKIPRTEEPDGLQSMGPQSWTRKKAIWLELIGDQPWVFIGGTDVEAEIPILWPPDEKS